MSMQNEKVCMSFYIVLVHHLNKKKRFPFLLNVNASKSIELKMSLAI